MVAPEGDDGPVRPLRRAQRGLVPSRPDLRGPIDGDWQATQASDAVEVRFLEVVPDVRVTQAVDFVSEDPAFAGTMTMTWELTPDGDRTHVTIWAADVPPGISPEDHQAGFRSSLEQLDAYVRQQ